MKNERKTQICVSFLILILTLSILPQSGLTLQTAQTSTNDQQHPFNMRDNIPTANFTFTMMHDPQYVFFDGSTSLNPNEGQDYRDLTYYWDFDYIEGDPDWDLIGNYADAGQITRHYAVIMPTYKNITLKVETPNHQQSPTLNRKILAVVYGDVRTDDSNGGFFLHLPFGNFAPLQNKCFVIAQPAMFHRVTFSIGGQTVVDDSPESYANGIWKKVVDESYGMPDENIKVRGYYYDVEVWASYIDTNIRPTPDWFIEFLKRSTVTISHTYDYNEWSMKVVPASIGSSNYFRDVYEAYLEGDYTMFTTIPQTKEFTMKSTDINGKSYGLVDGGRYGTDIVLSDYDFNQGKGDLSTYPSANVGSDSDGVYLEGWVSCDGSAKYEFDIPIFEIPFLFEAGVAGGFEGSMNVDMPLGQLGADGWSMNAGTQAHLDVDMAANTGIYGKLLVGLVELEGGLSTTGNLDVDMPSMENKLTVTGSIYAKASYLYGVGKKEWEHQIFIWEHQFKGKNPAGGSPRMDAFRTMDLLCLQDLKSTDGEQKSNTRDTTVLSGNVVGTAVPKIAVLENGYGLAVWSDITLVNDAIQSDVYWSVYDGSTWGPLQSTATDDHCEYDPEIVIIKDNYQTEYVVFTYLVVNDVVTTETDPTVFYTNPTINTVVCNEAGWYPSSQVLSVNSSFTVNTRHMAARTINSLVMTYLLDNDTDPFTYGQGRLFIIQGSLSDHQINWGQPRLLKQFSELTITEPVRTGFVDPQKGAVVYIQPNVTTGTNDIILLGTTSGVTGFSSHEYLVNSTPQAASSLSIVPVGQELWVFWVKNSSAICRNVVHTTANLNTWTFDSTELLYQDTIITSIQPVFTTEKKVLLFQKGEGFIPCLISEREDLTWGEPTPISLNETYSHQQLSGDSTSTQSHLVYLRKTPLTDWEKGHWRFNEGYGNQTADSSENKNNGVLHGSPRWLQHEGDQDLNQRYLYALEFPDSDSYVEVAVNESLYVSDMLTTCLWMNLNGTSSESTIIGRNNSWKILETNGFVTIDLWRQSGYQRLLNTVQLPNDTWVFLSLQYNQGNVNISLRPMNGQNTSAEYHFVNSPLQDTNEPLILGGFSGRLDDTWVFNRDITASEIHAIWFTPYPTLGSIQDVVTQQFPSFSSFQQETQGKSRQQFTTDDTVQFTASPSEYSYTWSFGDGGTATENPASHRFTIGGFYQVICTAFDPTTGVSTPICQSLNVIDTTLPVFSGVEIVTSGDCNATLSWSAAQDTAPFVSYHVYRWDASDIGNYSAPYYLTRNTSYVVHNLPIDTDSFFCVRAVDAYGNSEYNTRILSPPTPPYDGSAPRFAGVCFADRIQNQNAIYVEWDNATDPTPPITYKVYVTSTSGQYNFMEPNASTTQLFATINLSTNAPLVYVVVRAQDALSHIDQNVVEHTVVLGEHYEYLTGFPWYQADVDTGAAVAQMMLNYLFWNSTENPSGPPQHYADQQALFNAFNTGGGLTLTGDELCNGLNTKRPGAPGFTYGYFFSPFATTTANDAVKQICIWIDYPLNYYNSEWPVDGHPMHVPAAFPSYGNYDHWMVVHGLLANQDTWPPSQIQNLVVYGFWLNDPSVGGLGANTYVTISRFLSTYYLPLNVPGDIYNGKYLTINDPPKDIPVSIPETHVVIAQTSAALPTNDLALIKSKRIADTKQIQSILIDAAYKQSWDVLKNDITFAPLFKQAKVIGTPVLIRGEYLVVFGNNEIIFKVTLNRLADLQQIQVLRINQGLSTTNQ